MLYWSKEDTMTKREAYQILGLPPGAPFAEIKKTYRRLIAQVHPDTVPSTDGRSTHHAQRLNTAYGLLKKTSNPPKEHPPEKTAHAAWNAPVNEHAYMEREIWHCIGDHDGTSSSHFCIARGKYMWTAEEDLPLFLLSIYRCSEQLLDQIDARRPKDIPAPLRHQFQAELTYLLAQQFIDGSRLLGEFAREEAADKDGNRIFYIPATLEPSVPAPSLDKEETLYPAGLRHHRLYLKKRSGPRLGYLSFPDDRLYYIVIPLFEQKKVQIRIQAAGDRCHLHLWLKLLCHTSVTLPEDLGLQIRQILDRYERQM